MFRNRFITRVMAGVAFAGAAVLMTAPSATAYQPDFFEDNTFKSNNDCFVTGVVVTSNLLDVDVLDELDIEILEEGVAYVNLSCSTPHGSSAFASIFINGEVIPVSLELVYPNLGTILDGQFGFGEKKFAHGKFDHGGKFDGSGKFDHHDGKSHHKKSDRHFVYEGTAAITDEGIIDFLIDNIDETVPVRANGTTGTLDVVEAGFDIEILEVA